MLDKLPFYGGTKSTARKLAGERYEITCGVKKAASLWITDDRLEAYASFLRDTQSAVDLNRLTTSQRRVESSPLTDAYG